MPIASRLVAALATTVFAFTLAGCSSRGGGGGDVASVNGEKISRSDYEGKIEAAPQAKAVLNTLVQGILIDQYARDNHITISDAEVQKREGEIKAKYPAGQFEQVLKSQNLTEADVQRILRQQAVVEKAVEPNVKVTDADIKGYLDKNHTTLDTQAQARARHILVADLKTAQVVEQKLKAGAKFEAMASQYSTDPGSKIKGGELGMFTRTQMVPTFAQAAFTQPIGAIGPPVKSPFGYHIIQVEERKPAQIASMANSRDKIKTLLTQQQEQQQLPTFLSGLRSKANIQVYDDRLKDAIPTPLPTAGAVAPVPATSAAAAPAPAASAPSPAATK